MKTASDFLDSYSGFKTSGVSGRFLSRTELEKELERLKANYEIQEIGRSFLNLPIESIKVGNGKTKILAWSQMHGNETTTTKGILDLLNFLNIYKDDHEVKQILQNISLLIIPMLNPDGAARYTRENVNGVDLNRDALALTQPESRVLRKCFEEFAPHFCFNLHDQRTIFGAGDLPNPATISFLAPSMDVDRTVTASRKMAIKVIAVMNSTLQEFLPGQVGRFDDAFNLNCTGDYFQAQEVPTILFECGHFQKDYLREKTREFFTLSVFTALQAIASGSYNEQDSNEYLNIPENKKSFYDIILRHAEVAGEKADVAVQYSERMKSGEVHFYPTVVTMAPNLSFHGHMEINCKGGEVENLDGQPLSENDIVEAILLNKEKLLIKSPDIP